ncbi:MAG TPA: hypothetical protein VGJ15_13850 [Pirellulales bacterium]|jgi:hypothetical protein
MKRIICLAILFLTALAVGNATPAKAQGYCGGYGGCGINFPYGLYGSRVNDVPYFAMFPPVYYSMPVPRTYGWSPFAYPPGTMTPEVEADSPEELVNPYVPGNGASPAKPMSSKAITGRTAANGSRSRKTEAASTNTESASNPGPLVLINPYVQTDSAHSASTKVAEK